MKKAKPEIWNFALCISLAIILVRFKLKIKCFYNVFITFCLWYELNKKLHYYLCMLHKEIKLLKICQIKNRHFQLQKNGDFD